MRKFSTFKNAYDIWHGGRILRTSESENRVYYTVVDPHSKKEHEVTVYFDDENKVIGMSCTCTIQALKIVHRPLCSHMMGLVPILLYQYGKPKRRKSR